MDNYALQYQGQEIDDLLQKIDDLDVATDESSGLMSAQDKSKLDEIESGAEENLIETIVLGDQSLPPSGSKTVTIPMDDVPAMGSNNPVKSSGVYAEIADIKEVIPTTAAPGNKLTPKSQVDALIATALLNYYLKSETYSKSEINALIAGIKQFTYQVVDSLPTASADTMYIVYFVPSSNPDTQNVKDEYITIESNGVYSFEQIGSTSIDISGKADKDTDAVAGNLAKFDANGNPVDAGIAAEKVAQKGEIQTYSGNLVDTRSAGTAQEFTYRKSGGDGVNWMRRIKGKSLVWNQLCPFTSTHTITNATWTNNTLLATAKNGQVFWNAPADGIIVGHKYIQIAILKTTAAARQIRAFSLGESMDLYNVAASGSYQVLAGIATATNTLRAIAIRDTRESDWDAIEVAGVMLIDLTLMFGAGNEPSTVEEFEAMYPLPYYAYNAGEIISNNANSIETVGFNQWDEEWELGTYDSTTGAKKTYVNSIRCKNFIRVSANTQYYLYSPATAQPFGRVLFYDADYGYIGSWLVDTPANRQWLTPANCSYVTFYLTASYGTTYNHDICINISDASRNGTYEPYWKKSIQLGLNAFRVTDGTNIITVNGLKSAGSVYDEIDLVRKKNIKRVETRAYQSGDESNASVITDMTNTNYALATPVEYDLVDDIPNAIEVDENGTERAIFPEAVDPSAPFCSDSNYSVSTANLVRKLNDAS